MRLCGAENFPLSSKKTETAFLCQCKRTNNPPYCDGTHRDLTAETPKTTPVSDPKTRNRSAPNILDANHPYFRFANHAF